MSLRCPQRTLQAGIAIEPLESAPLEAWSAPLVGSDWIVDALLGTGSSGAPRGAVATAIEAINRARAADAPLRRARARQRARARAHTLDLVACA
jgi:NAD(P)H-hydrate repair Nnr-like enzyme with NAD(P)H-hydrate epimerase domain